ncbi:hypothetical protein IMG5_118380 [Ichthyophthirius multifiliis]|uniref:Translation initiation factor eIF2B subunit beta n=1 Tax=Ichthyophthirius multifiliis TaxID=5932 RepID=G0QUP6_ICHMU|nr:hypothetical protein IMG5_118380 [Ichthyophthirius multifiliis]EGR31060.1 hypothetical protein IMG5_118380 [Ichthyophthirius multifiliis]|eukprot:XP_004034546.1 hypothetical protein IMG5_118380 [Ichthyophthirius multifiliis]
MEENNLDFSVENLIRKVLTIINEINEQTDKKKQKGFSNLKKIFEKDEESLNITHLEDIKEFQVKTNQFIEGVNNLIEELQDLPQTISQYSATHINSNEVIITYGYSYTVKVFLINAKKQRDFEVIVFEQENSTNGQKMASELQREGGITTFLAPFSSIYAFMSRVNKIFLGAHAIMKNGGILGKTGIFMISSAAKAYSVPVIILSSAIKLTPLFPFEQNTYNDIQNPFNVYQGNIEYSNNQTIISTKLDYIAPEYISLYITNYGEHTPAYIYRLFNEFYSREDV